ncbi:hypothetical protein [Tenacibaculum ovolyticum]|uniref:hypothetical protein n=1 Tax=Tenacibaculum ovolyticum TaxID=104270 RepID=UPI0007EDD316|nr:hypothetical protein [Tenacibaculum ovolyticum]
MSHTLDMYVRNKSSYTIRSYSVSHSWDGHNENLNGRNLPNGGGESHKIKITSGYSNYDWYTVQITFDGLGVRQTDFYCNSSQSNKRIVIEIFDGWLDCNYYDNSSSGGYDTGCNHKHWSGEFVDEEKQLDVKKIKSSQKSI